MLVSPQAPPFVKESKATTIKGPLILHFANAESSVAANQPSLGRAVFWMYQLMLFCRGLASIDTRWDPSSQTFFSAKQNPLTARAIA
jgi:hypothetical protein